ncbi:MAG: PotD/PotF family extracellular solute-binding protein [Haloplanus sp.]
MSDRNKSHERSNRAGRRAVLKTGLAVSAAGLTGLAGCSGGGGGGGDGTADSIKAFLWEGYEPVVQAFEEETGITVEQENATSTNNMFTKTKNAPGEYDLVTPNSGYAQRFREADLIQPLADGLDAFIQQVPNFENTYDYFRQGTIKRHLSDDQGRWYGAPPRFGLYGIGLDTDQVDPADVQSCADIWNNRDKFGGGVGVNVDEVHSITHAVRALGYADMLRGEQMAVSGGAWEETRQKFLELANFTRAMFESEAQVGRALKSESYNVAVGPGRNDIINLIQKGNTQFEFVSPSEGAIGWTEAMLVPKQSQKTEAAMKFMNFILRPKMGAELAKSDLAPSVVSGAKEYMTQEEIDLFYIPPEQVQDVIQDKPFAEPEKWKALMNEFRTQL